MFVRKRWLVNLNHYKWSSQLVPIFSRYSLYKVPVHGRTKCSPTDWDVKNHNDNDHGRGDATDEGLCSRSRHFASPWHPTFFSPTTSISTSTSTWADDIQEILFLSFDIQVHLLLWKSGQSGILYAAAVKSIKGAESFVANSTARRSQNELVQQDLPMIHWIWLDGLMRALFVCWQSRYPGCGTQ